MKILPLSLFVSAALVAPISAQQMGMVNRDAPKVEQKIEFNNGNELEISYTAINWAQGKFAERVKSDAAFRNMVNTNAKQNPIGSFDLAGDATIGGKKVMAGHYGLHFLVNDNGGWQMALSHKKGDEVELTTWDLDLSKSDKLKKRLSIVLSAADEADQCHVELHFGNMAVEISAQVMPATKQRGEEEEEEEADEAEEHEGKAEKPMKPMKEKEEKDERR